jgi:inner membrane protein
MAEQPSWIEGFFDRHQTYLKMGFLLVLVLILLIPLELIKGLIGERAQRRDVVAHEIGQTWGRHQIIAGPVLIVPYRYTVEQKKDWQTVRVERRAHAFFLPERLETIASVIPEVRYRGIFEAIVYSASLRLSGKFTPPDFEPLGIDDKDVFLDDAVLAFGVTDLRGTSGVPVLTWAEQKIALLPGTTNDLLGSGAHAPVGFDPAKPAANAFDLALQIKGSQAISFTPSGKTTSVQITSPWRHPSFIGTYLPDQRTVGDAGFEASWKVSYLGRAFPQSWTSQDPELSSYTKRLRGTRFGAGLISPVDFYLKSERAIKHGALFIVLIFAVIFIFEFITPLKIHAVQYGLLGSALCLFYLLLLSLSEVIGFLIAYGTAATLSTALITLYIGKILGSRGRALLIAGILGATYGYLYVLLQLEGLSLVSGATGLFVALAAVMYATRNVNWYAIKRS